MNSIEWTAKALRQARKFPAADQTSIADAIDALHTRPNIPNVRALRGRSGYRLRAGRYRVLFTVHAGIFLVIRIVEVKKRDEHTC
ncbi:MAG: type II toxin-antitoxin system RelE/ParE family toxin [Desulfovibrio sp.]|jgi:mRNA interferase RelE/StbE|nr:type II toxin-antitoxin system RelE/ParE family toxin [Desulfovibrio sp.]